MQHHTGTSQCGSSLAIPLRVSDELHRSMTYVFDVTTELACEQIMDSSLGRDRKSCDTIIELRDCASTDHGKSTYESRSDRMTEFATNYQNSLQYEDIAPLQLGKAALDCVTEHMKVRSFEQNPVDGG